MATEPNQRLLVLTVDPLKENDYTKMLSNFPWWGDGWSIQQVSVAPAGDKNTHAYVAVVLNKEPESYKGSSGIR